MTKRNTGIPKEIYEPQYDYEPYISFEQSPTYISNFDKEEKPKYLRAIAEYENKYPDRKGQLYIEDNAYDCFGSLLESCNSLHCLTNFCLSPFWRIKEALDKKGE